MHCLGPILILIQKRYWKNCIGDSGTKLVKRVAIPRSIQELDYCY